MTALLDGLEQIYGFSELPRSAGGALRGRGIRPVTPLEIYLWDVLWFIQYLTVSFCMDRLHHKSRVLQFISLLYDATPTLLTPFHP
jgi:hypothetical protein